jgi:CysZ protein
MGWIARHPGSWLVGLIPALIATTLYVAALVALGVYLDEIAAALTPFAAGWSDFWRQTVRVTAMIAVFGVAMLVSVVTFTAVTLVIGQPFYELLAERVEDWAGGAPPSLETPLWRQIARSARDGLIIASLAAAIGIVLIVFGFIPIVGQTVIPVIGAAVSGYFLTVELTSIALERRGIGRRGRLVLLRRNRWLAVGFGAFAWLIFLIPLGAVVVMPGAVAGATLLVRERLAVSTQL